MSDLTAALPGLGFVGLAVSLVALFGRDPKADQHDVSDYHEPTILRRDWNGLDWNKTTDDVEWGLDILPPAPEGTNAGGSPLYAALYSEQVIAEQLRAQYGTTNPDRIADAMLRELAAEQVTR